jgi:hypothetical protein
VMVGKKLCIITKTNNLNSLTPALAPSRAALVRDDLMINYSTA